MAHHSPAETWTLHAHVAICPLWPQDVSAGRASLPPAVTCGLLQPRCPRQERPVTMETLLSLQ